jgi:hypothetical protein
MTNRIQRIGLLTAMALLTINIYTGGPLLAVWVGSKVQGSGPPSMGALFAVAATLAAVSLVLIWLMSRVGSRYDALSGKGRSVRRTVPWLRSMRGERQTDARERGEQTSSMDMILVTCVVLGVVGFEVWFFFFAGSSIGHG